MLNPTDLIGKTSETLLAEQQGFSLKLSTKITETASRIAHHSSYLIYKKHGSQTVLLNIEFSFDAAVAKFNDYLPKRQDFYNLYVWNSVKFLSEPGLCFAMATTKEEAIKQILLSFGKKYPSDSFSLIRKELTDSEPEIYYTPIGFVLEGSE